MTPPKNKNLGMGLLQKNSAKTFFSLYPWQSYHKLTASGYNWFMCQTWDAQQHKSQEYTVVPHKPYVQNLYVYYLFTDTGNPFIAITFT
jgi:phosphohistidine phosphatase SixA